MLRALDLTKSYDGAPLFDGLSLTLDDGARAGLVGANGAGKSTLLRAAGGRRASRPRRGRARAATRRLPAAGRARPAGDDRRPVATSARARCGRCRRLRARRARARPDRPRRLRRAQARFEALGGWALEARAGRGAPAARIEHLDRGAPLGRLSGGERRAACWPRCCSATPPCCCSTSRPTTSTPTAAHGCEWLPRRFAGTLLVVSHDRRFLDAVVDRVVRAVGRAALETYEGGYTAYREERDRRRERLAQLVEAQDKRRRRLEADIAMTSRQARRTERTRRAGRRADSSSATRRRWRRSPRRASTGSSARWRRDVGAGAARGGRVQGPCSTATPPTAGGRVARASRVDGVFAGVDLTLHGGDRVALVGPNGAGKSTLLHVLAARWSRRRRGRRARRGPAAPADARAAAGRAARCSTGSASRPRLPEDEARTLLAHYRLGAEAIARPIGRLSPGERARVHVAAIVAAGADLILLDEPTNHLDFDTLEVIEAALRGLPGTLVVASHDRLLLDAIGTTRDLHVEAGGGLTNGISTSSRE